MQIFHDAGDALRHPSPYITPYLDLRSRISQVWINRWTVLLLLVLVRTLFAIADIRDGIDDAHREALSACTGVENIGSAVASMPHYLAQGTNKLTAEGVEHAINGLMSMINMSVTGVEELVVFVVNLLTSTYLCLITLAVSGALHAAIQIIEDVGNFLNRTIGEIGTDIHHGINDFQTDLNKVIGGLNKIPEAFGSHAQIPTVNINGSLDRLDHLQLPGGLDQGLSKLNNSIPSFDQVNNFTNNIIRTPFEEIKKLINQSLPHYHFNQSLFPVPAKDELHFCNDNDGITDFFQGLVDIEDGARKVAITALVILAVLVIFPMAGFEMYRWRSTQNRAQLIHDNAYDPIDVVYIASRPLTSTLGIRLGEEMGNYRRQNLARWMIAYATSPPALFVLSLGIAGLFSTLCHYLVLTAVAKEAPNLEHQVAQFADKVVDSLNNASVHWANETNGAILGMNGRINHDVFGWVNTSTSAMNETLNAFSDEMTKALNATFGHTVLEGPIMEVYNCLIGLKIAGIEKGLTWIQDHAHIDFPLLPNNTFSLGAAAAKTGNNNAASFLASPDSDATSKINATVAALVNKFTKKIEREAIISGVIVGIWAIIFLGAILRVLTLWFGSRHDAKLYGARPFMLMVGNDQMAEKSRFAPDIADKKRAVSAANPFADPPLDNHSRTAPPSYITQKDPACTGANAANTYQGSEYTLKPRPFPSFASDTLPATPAANPGREVSPMEERMGYAGERLAPQQQNGIPRRSATADMLGLGGHKEGT